MKIRNYILSAATLIAMSCTTQETNDPLPSWNDTPIKQQILEYVNVQAAQIPVEDRIAVFDMDGTIACERPLWYEMAVAAQKMADDAEANPDLMKQTSYQYATKLAKNPEDTTVLNHWFVDGEDYLDSLLLKSFEGVEYEDFVDYARNYITNTDAPKYGKYGDLFYQPMLELLDFLKQKQFQIYIVSGSMQGIVWSICPQTTGFDRSHLIGTRQTIGVNFDKADQVSYVIKKSVLKPKNNYYGKSINIYYHIGKIPVMAVGNTVGDFGMFHMASKSKYPHFAMMLNHDDAEREYAYEPFYSGNPNWQDSLRLNNWIQADMSKEFKTVWMKK